MKARNAHAAGLNDTPPGEVGEFDEKNDAVKAWLAAGLLVAVEDVPTAPDSAAAEVLKKRKA